MPEEFMQSTACSQKSIHQFASSFPFILLSSSLLSLFFKLHSWLWLTLRVTLLRLSSELCWRQRTALPHTPPWVHTRQLTGLFKTLTSQPTAARETCSQGINMYHLNPKNFLVPSEGSQFWMKKGLMKLKASRQITGKVNHDTLSWRKKKKV